MGGYGGAAVERTCDEGDAQGEDGDGGAGQRQAGVAVSSGEDEAAEAGAEGVAEVEGALVEGGGEVGRAFGFVYDAGLKGGTYGEVDGSPEKDHGDGGDRAALGKRHDEEDDDEEQ